MSDYEKLLVEKVSNWIDILNNKRIVIYGIGGYTKTIIDNFPNLNIIGLMDAKSNGSIIYDKKVLSEQEVVDCCTDVILICSLTSNVTIICSRIRDFCYQNGIEVFSLSGKRYSVDECELLDKMMSSCATKADKVIFETFIKLVKDTDFEEKIKSASVFGKCFWGPVTYMIISWIYNRLIEENIDVIFWGARDGYILNEAFNYIYGNKHIKSKYLLISRIASLLPSIQNDEDLLFAANMPFVGSKKELLISRFHLGDNLERADEFETIEECISFYKSSIFNQIEEERTNIKEYYNGYMTEISHEKIAFFDLISTGSCLRNLQKILNRKILGLFLSKGYNPDYDYTEMRIRSIFKTSDNHTGDNFADRNHYLLESVFTSYEASLIAVDKNGNPIFGVEKRTNEDIADLKDIHKGIFEFLDIVKQNELEKEEVSIALIDDIIMYLDLFVDKESLPLVRGTDLYDEFANIDFSLK